MNGHVYFSKRIGKTTEFNKWIDDNENASIRIILVPKPFWSIKGWKMVIDFSKNFRSSFIESTHNR